MQNNNYLLIGFMGVGKGTVAREISKSLQYFVIDTDDLIESLENKKIKKIFEDDGEIYFRNLEKQCSKWLENNVTNTVISTGGGFYKQKNISKIGKIIYLESSFESIINRIKSHPNSKSKIEKRPLLKNEKKAKELFKQRIKEYKKVSNFIVNVENKNIKDILKEIKKIIKS